MADHSGDNLYELELQIPDASGLWLPESGGADTIAVLEAHDEVVEINLAFQVDANGTSGAAMARYFGGRFDIWHQMIIQGAVEHATGSPGRDLITGNELDNRLWGEAGADTISGGVGRDTVEGGAGADHLFGGGEAGDVLSYQGSDFGVMIALEDLSVVLGRGGDAEGDVLQGFTAIIGSGLRDILSDDGTSTGGQDNAFYGGGGRDRLMLGGGNDTGVGGFGADFLTGEAGDDRLDGSFGNDLLLGGAGVDTLTGGSGADVFEFRRASESGTALAMQDIVTDFSAADGDRIDLEALDADSGTAGNQAFQLISGAFSGQAGELRQATQGDDLMLLGDTDGDGLADFAILLQAVSSLSAGDFAL